MSTPPPARTIFSVDAVEGSRLDEVADIFRRHQAGSARSLQTDIGPSEAGHPCDRHLAYKLKRIAPAVPETLHWAALLGTWAHGGAEDAMQDENARICEAAFQANSNDVADPDRFVIEGATEIEPGLVPTGHTDVYDTVTGEVWDWKFVGESTMKTYRQKGAGRRYIVQAMLYGLGWTRAGYDVKAVRIFFLPRWSNEIHDGFDWAVKYNEAIALDALARLRTVNAAATLVAGGLAPWTELAEDTTECRFCPWLRRSRPGQPRADETGCHGFYRADESAELAALGGAPVASSAPNSGGRVPAQSSAPTGDPLLFLIRNATHQNELIGLWREADAKGMWAEAHTEAAAKRKAELQ